MQNPSSLTALARQAQTNADKVESDGSYHDNKVFETIKPITATEELQAKNSRTGAIRPEDGCGSLCGGLSPGNGISGVGAKHSDHAARLRWE